MLNSCMHSTHVRTSAALTLFNVEFLHSGDEVWSGVEVMWTGLLQATQAKEGSICSCTAGEGPAAGNAWIARPALGLQVKGLESGNWHLALTPT